MTTLKTKEILNPKLLPHTSESLVNKFRIFLKEEALGQTEQKPKTCSLAYSYQPLRKVEMDEEIRAHTAVDWVDKYALAAETMDSEALEPHNLNEAEILPWLEAMRRGNTVKRN